MKKLCRNLIFIILFLSANYIYSAMNIVKTVNKTGVSLGAQLTYIIYYENTGPSNLTGVNLWDTIPQRTSFINATTGSVNSGIWSLNIGNLNAGVSGSVTITVQIDSTLNTGTANIRNVAYIQSNEEGVKSSMPVFTTVVKTPGGSVQYVSYGAWEDNIKKNMGFIHIYTLADNTDLILNYADNAMTQMNGVTTINGGQNFPAGKVVNFPNDVPSYNDSTGDCSISNGLNEVLSHNVNTRYFKLTSNKPFIWIFDSIVDDNWSDSQIFLMSTDFKFTGSTFFTHLYYDRNPYDAPTYSHSTDIRFGDSIGIININPFPIAAYVYVSTDLGQNWYFRVSNTVMPETSSTGGIWMYGGTTKTCEGDYKIILRALDSNGEDNGDANGIAWKGNLFAGYRVNPCGGCGAGESCSKGDRDSDHDNNNAFVINLKGNKISDPDSDVLYGCISKAYIYNNSYAGRGELVITNVGPASNTAIVDVYKYRSASSGLVDPVPVSSGSFGNSGNWMLWKSNLSIAGQSSLTVYNGLPYDDQLSPSAAESYGSFIKIVLKSGGPIQAVGGSNIFGAHYGQADYLEAADTKLAVGTEFYLGNANYQAVRSWPPNLDWWTDNKGGILIALCPIPNTTVQIVQGNLVDVGAGTEHGTNAYSGTTPLIQTTGATPDQALKFYSLNSNTTYKIISNNKIYLMYQNLKGREKVFSGVVVDVEFLYPQVNLSKSANTSQVYQGDTVTYTIKFTNNGMGDAYDTIVIDTIPSNATYIGASRAPIGSTGNVFTWALNSPILANGGQDLFDLYLQINASANTCITNTADAHYTDSTGNSKFSRASNESIVCVLATSTPTNTRTFTPTFTFTFTPTMTPTPTPAPDFSLSKSVFPNPANLKDTVIYTITYRNTGISAATGVIIWDTLPEKHIYVSGSGGNYVSRIITFNIGTVGVGEQASVSFAATISEDAEKGLRIKNVANLQCNEKASKYISNETDLEVIVPDLKLEIVTNYPNPFNKGTVLVFNLSVKAEVTIKVFTLAGEPVRTLKPLDVKRNLVNQVDIRPGENRVYWDGFNDYNEKASSGVYIYKIEAKTKDENIFKFSKLAVMR